MFLSCRQSSLNKIFNINEILINIFVKNIKKSTVDKLNWASADRRDDFNSQTEAKKKKRSI